MNASAASPRNGHDGRSHGLPWWEGGNGRLLRVRGDCAEIAVDEGLFGF